MSPSALSSPRPYSTDESKAKPARAGIQANRDMPSTERPYRDDGDGSSVTFYVSGEPKGQPRPRAVRMGPGVRIYDPGTADLWKQAVADHAELEQRLTPDPTTQPLMMELEFVMPRPRKHYRTGKKAHELKPDAPIWHLTKPDVDNLAKATVDSMAGIAYDDDRSIASLTATKRYAGPGEPTGCLISISRLPS